MTFLLFGIGNWGFELGFGLGGFRPKGLGSGLANLCTKLHCLYALLHCYINVSMTKLLILMHHTTV